MQIEIIDTGVDRVWTFSCPVSMKSSPSRFGGVVMMFNVTDVKPRLSASLLCLCLYPHFSEFIPCPHFSFLTHTFAQTFIRVQLIPTRDCGPEQSGPQSLCVSHDNCYLGFLLPVYGIMIAPLYCKHITFVMSASLNSFASQYDLPLYQNIILVLIGMVSIMCSLYSLNSLQSLAFSNVQTTDARSMWKLRCPNGPKGKCGTIL